MLRRASVKVNLGSALCNRAALENPHLSGLFSKWQCVFILVFIYVTYMTTMHSRRRQREPISTLSFVQMIIVTSLSMNFLVWIQKACILSGISSHAALIQTAPLQIDYMLCGKEVYFRDV